MKRIFIPVLLSLTLLVFGFGQEQPKRNHIGVGFDTISNLLPAGFSLSIAPALGNKVLFDLGAAYYPMLGLEGLPKYFSVSAAPLFSITANIKLNVYVGPGFKMLFASGGYLEETRVTPIVFLKGLLVYNINSSWGMRLGLCENYVFQDQTYDESINYLTTGIEWGFFWRF